jgi:hypothetical protein
MARKLSFLIFLVSVLPAAAWSQTMIEYGGVSATSSPGISKAADATTKAVGGLGKRLGNSIAGASSGGSEPGQQNHLSSPDSLMRSNRQTLEQGAGKHGAMLHVSSVPQGATVFVDHRPVALAPVDLRLPAGKHTIELKSPSYSDWSQEVSVSDGEKLSYEPKLQENKQAQSDSGIINLSF